jgi:hypothetical protein
MKVEVAFWLVVMAAISDVLLDGVTFLLPG